MDLLRLTPSELQLRGSSLKRTRDIKRGTKLSGIRARAEGEGVAFCPTKVLAEAIVPFLIPTPMHSESQQVGTISESPST